MQIIVMRGLIFPVRLLKVSARRTSAPVAFNAVDNGIVPIVMKITGLLIALIASLSVKIPVRTRVKAPRHAGYHVLILRIAQAIIPRIVNVKMTAVIFSCFTVNAPAFFLPFAAAAAFFSSASADEGIFPKSGAILTVSQTITGVRKMIAGIFTIILVKYVNVPTPPKFSTIVFCAK